MKNIRTFVAIEASPTVRQRAVALIDVLREAPAEVKWVAPENMHLTLKFLGDIDFGKIPEVCELVKRAVAAVAPFELEIRGAGAFPNPTRPGTVWIGADEGAEQMEALFKPVEKAVRRLGVRREPRRFHAHLTLGRVRRGGPGVEALGELIRQQSDYEAGRMIVRGVKVFSSELRREGPLYNVLGSASLGGKAR